MWTKCLGAGVALGLLVSPPSYWADERSDSETGKLRAQIKELQAEKATLQAEVARLKDELYWVPGPKAKGAQKLAMKTTLKEGISLSAAMKVLGPPSTLSDGYTEWYSNPRGLHVAPYVSAKMTKQGLVGWKTGYR